MEDLLEPSVSVDWSDDFFKDKFMTEHKLPRRISVTQSIECAKAFVNWYVSGKGGTAALDMWIGVVSGIHLPTSRSGELRIPFERLTVDSMYGNKCDPQGTRDINVNKLIDFIYKSEGPDFRSADAKNWHSYIFEKLQSRGNNLINDSAFSAVSYLGYIAMGLLRLLVRDAAKLSHDIVKNVTNEFNSFWGERTIRLPTPPPHMYAVNQCRNLFQKTSPKSNKALTLILATYAFTPQSSNRTLVRSILKKACLDDLEYHGMGCFYWLQQAETATNVPAKVIVDCMAKVDESPTSSELFRVLEFSDNPKNLEYTWPWSRLLIDKVFVEISISKNPQYAAIMAAIASDRNESSSVWNIKQFRDAEIKKNALHLSRFVIKQIKTKPK